MRLPRACSFTVLLSLAACTNTSNNAPAGSAADAGGDAGLRGVPYLWYAGGALSAFTREQTLATNDDGPAWQVVPARASHNCHDLAFDGAGNLWTIPVDGDQILRLPASRLAALAPVVPDLVVTSPALAGPVSLIFDAAGNLWVLNFNGAGPAVASVVRFDDPRALSGTQTLSPSVTIKPGASPAEAARFTQATTIAFDAAGNLWLAAVAGALRLDHAAALGGDVTAAPSATVATSEAYGSLAFDAAGSVWITATQGGSYFALRFSAPGSWTGAVAPTPAARILVSVPGAAFAGGMAFDADGALWIATSAALVKLAHADLVSGDARPTPAVVLGDAAFPDIASKLVVRPPPPGLPLAAP